MSFSEAKEREFKALYTCRHLATVGWTVNARKVSQIKDPAFSLRETVNAYTYTNPWRKSIKDQKNQTKREMTTGPQYRRPQRKHSA